MRKDSVEFIRLLYLAVQRVMREHKKIRILKDTAFHQKKQILPKNHNYT